MNAGSAGDRCRVQALMNWLFATDARCNHYARARRLGVMYIIWNRRMFRMYDTDRGWAPYSGPSPHTDHVHFSLTRAGGAGRVSFCGPTFRAPAGWTPSSAGSATSRSAATWTAIRPLDRRLRRRRARRPALVRRRDGRRAQVGTAGPTVASWPGPLTAAAPGLTPLVGDFNGDCRADVIWFDGPGAARSPVAGPGRPHLPQGDRDQPEDYEHAGGRRLQRRPGPATSSGTTPAPAQDLLWRGSPYGFVARPVSDGRRLPALRRRLRRRPPRRRVLVRPGRGAGPALVRHGRRLHRRRRSTSP